MDTPLSNGGGGLPFVGSCSYRPDTKEANFKKGTAASGLSPEDTGFVGFLLKKLYKSEAS